MSQKRANELSAKIDAARYKYYNGESDVSDEEYDAWVDELTTIDPNHKSVISIGAPIAENSEWPKAKHKIPLGSLDKVNTPEELSKWIHNIFSPNNSICYSDKADGLSIEAIYENGKLIQAITRGLDGLVGEDITPNVSKMGGVKKQLPVNFTGSLRGEILLTLTNHKQFFPEYANPRNAASGISRRLDGKGSEHLNVLFYQAIGNTDFESEFLQLKYIEETLQLDTPNYEAFVGNTVDELVNFVLGKWEKYQQETRKSLNYMIDGLVISVNDLKYQQSLGEHHLRPKGKIAFKFRNEFATTTVKEVKWETGNSGRITPVCWFEKTLLQGSNIEKASVYNIAYIKELNLGVNAEVLVCKANEIIPRVEKVLKPGIPITIPTRCPACEGQTEMQGENLVCVSVDTCPAQVVGRIKNWINHLNILEWGDTLIERLVQSGKVVSIPDLYKLSIEDLMSIERMGQRSAEKCFNILWSEPAIPLATLLGSLSIPLASTSTIEMIIDAGYDTLDVILALTEEQLRSIKGLGPVKAASVFNGLKRNKDLIFELLKQGICIKENNMSDTTNVNGKLSGKSFVLTGKMLHPRKELEAMIEANGGTHESGVRKTTTHLVIADPNSTSTKAVAARKAGITLISEEELLGMME
jgi:DNA ligase (NAD+)